MRPTHWKCYRCRKMKKLPEEIDRADLYAVCRDCRNQMHPTLTAAEGREPHEVTVHRRGINRRHSTDNRD